jgi:transcriptional regulator with XRE-family HTH domain
MLGGMDTRPEPPPWGKLIIDALQESGLSARKAATKAGISDGRWRQIALGYQNVSAGVYAPVRGPAETLARMARVVGVTPEQLEQAGRPDAATELRELSGGNGRPSNLETAELLRQKILELRTAMDEKFGPENKQVRDHLIGGLEAMVDESTADRADR